jgi:linoleoyl-CoA desaturase
LRDRHIDIPQDSDLLKSIYRQAEQDLVVDKVQFRAIIWSKFIFYAALAVVTYSGLYVIESRALFVLCFVLYGFSILLFAFNFAHDFSHNTIFKKSGWDQFGFIVIYAMNGAHAEAWKKRHIESHHFAPNVEHYDTDLEISRLIRVIPGSECSWFHKFQHVYAPLAYTTYSLYWVLIKDFFIFFKDHSPHKVSYHLSFWSQKVFYFMYLVVLPIAYSGQPWYLVLVGFLMMHLLQSLFLLFTFFITHHVEGVEYPTTDPDGFINASWVMNQIKSSNDIYPFSSTANFILGGFNNHIAHHLFPHVHHIHYPKLNRILYRTLNEKGINPNQTTYWGGIRSHLRLLKRMGQTSVQGNVLHNAW